MCIEPEGSFIATASFYAFRLCEKDGDERKSLISPRLRRVKGMWDFKEGVSLRYPIGDWVVSPSGPGLHCWYVSEYQDPATWGKFEFHRPHTVIVVLLVPVGAKIYWSRERSDMNLQEAELALAVSEALVLT